MIPLGEGILALHPMDDDDENAEEGWGQCLKYEAIRGKCIVH